MSPGDRVCIPDAEVRAIDHPLYRGARRTCGTCRNLFQGRCGLDNKYGPHEEVADVRAYLVSDRSGDCARHLWVVFSDARQALYKTLREATAAPLPWREAGGSQGFLGAEIPFHGASMTVGVHLDGSAGWFATWGDEEAITVNGGSPEECLALLLERVHAYFRDGMLAVVALQGRP